MANWIILTAFVAGMALTVGSTIHTGATNAAAKMFVADSFAAKWLSNEHYEGE